MKNYFILSAVSMMLFSCGEKRICNHNGEDIPCEYYDLYTEHASIEAQINASFEDDAVITFEESYALREQWKTLYDNTDSLKKAYDLVGEKGTLDFLSEMRLKEYDYFQEQKVYRVELKEILKSMDIKATDSDSSFWGSQVPSLIWTITNNSDKAIKSIAIKKNYTLNGETVKQDGNTSYLFMADQIIPRPTEEEGNNVMPGSSVILDFKKPKEGEIVPEITRINFVEE